MNHIQLLTATCIALCSGLACAADTTDALIRATITERIPQLGRIDEVRPTEVPGIYEVRYNGASILYSDSKGEFVFQGQLIETKSRANLTQERIEELTAIRFDSLPFKDSFTIVRGKGERKLAIFEDPNCGYCKQFERQLAKVDNITISVFLYPILSADSNAKSQAIWCAADRNQAWLDWMVRDRPVPPALPNCESAALKRNFEYGRANHITGTPTLLFESGARVGGAIDITRLEKYLSAQKQ